MDLVGCLFVLLTKISETTQLRPTDQPIIQRDNSTKPKREPILEAVEFNIRLKLLPWLLFLY